MQYKGTPLPGVFTRLSPVFLLSSIIKICPRCIIRLVDGSLWLKLLPVLGVNTGDSAVGVIQQNPVASDLQYHKTPTRLVVVYATSERLLNGMLFHNHIDVLFPLLVVT